MKKQWFATVAFVLMVAVTGMSLSEGIYLPGTYEGTGTGFGGDGSIYVGIVVDENEITEVTARGEQETPAIGGAALETLCAQVVAAQSADIDGVSGATITSGGVKAAAAMALALARGEEAPVEEAQPLPEGLVLGENEYYGSDANGAGGTVAVIVTMDGERIAKIKVIEQHETRGLGTNGLLKTIDEIMKANSADVDSVSGATLSSNALKRAVSRALASAGK